MPERVNFKSELLTVGNVKTTKGEKLGYLTFIQHFAPAKLSGREVCPSRSAGCTAACLNAAGRGGMTTRGTTFASGTIQSARRRRTLMFFNQRDEYFALLIRDIERAIVKARKLGMVPCFRLNGTSDLAWEREIIAQGQTIFDRFPDVQFYDYTKVYERLGRTPPNYDLTFSASEDNIPQVELVLRQRSARVAAVFTDVPPRFWEVPVINGDDTDLRFLDPKGIVIGLTLKRLTSPGGKRRMEAARRQGFVQNPQGDLFDPLDQWGSSQVVFDAKAEVVYV